MAITYKMLSYPISSGFGTTSGLHRVPHSGIDLATPTGTQAQSLTNGIIENITTNDPILGASVRVDAGNGQDWLYGHLSQINVSTGQQINSGDVLGLTGGVPGTSGAGLSSGAHLHLAALQNGTPIDPSIALGGGGGFWDTLKEIIITPGADLAGAPPLHASLTEIVFEWLGSGMVTLIQIMPEVCGIFAMAFLLIGMIGSQRFMRYAGTSVLLSFLGVLLNAAIG